MREITVEEADELLDSEENIGYFCFMGGINSDAKRVIVATKDKYYLLEDEKIPEDIMQEIDKETEEYIDKYHY